MVRHASMLTVPMVLTMTAPATTCLGQERDHFLQTYAGEPYTGRVSVRIVRPGTSRNAGRLDFGTSTAEFSAQENGKIRLVLVGNIVDSSDRCALAKALDGVDPEHTRYRGVAEA